MRSDEIDMEGITTNLKHKDAHTLHIVLIGSKYGNR